MQPLTHLDLFSGIGGFALAAQNCGYTTIGFCEKEPYAQQILKERFGAVWADASGSTLTERNNRREEHQPHGRNEIRNQHCTSSSRPKLHDNIFTLDGSDYAGVDLLTGGFPCQPFSVAGKRKGAADDRALWPEMLRVINGAQPRWLIGENVAGIVTMELDSILSDLEGIGYAAWPIVVPACAVDAKHRRDRVWIIGRKNVEDSRDMRNNGGCGVSRQCQGEGAASKAAGSGEDVAHANERRGQQRDKNERSLSKPDSECAGSGEDVAHADSQRGCVREANGSDAGDAWKSPCTWKDEGEWFAESGMGRVAHGIPHRAHRLRGLGNAIVPQVAFEIIRAIRAIEESQSI